MSMDLDRIADAQAAFASLRRRVAAREPWTLAVDFGPGPEASWGPREVLAHVAEMLPFWLGELERVLDGAPGPTAFGRVADDPLRLGVIERDRTLPLRVLFSRVDDGLRDCSVRLTALTDDERAAVGRHGRLGDIPAGTILERLAIAHAEDHIAQLESILASGPG
jgi:hypothetical protein